MIRTSDLIKGILVYILFILGFAIISEWLCDANVKKETFDSLLQEAKDDIRREFIDRFPQQPQPTRYINQPPSQLTPVHPSVVHTDEEKILKEVSSKLDGGNTYSLDGHAVGNQSLGDVYSKIDIPTDYITTQKTVNFLGMDERQKTVIKEKTEYIIDNKYSYDISNYSNIEGIDVYANSYSLL